MGQPTNTSAFIDQLLAPLSVEDQDELHAEGSGALHRNWFLAEMHYHRREAQRFERLENSFYGDNQLRDCKILKANANEAANALALTPATSKCELQTKRVLLRKILGRDLPDHVVAALDADEAYIARKAARRAERRAA